MKTVRCSPDMLSKVKNEIGRMHILEAARNEAKAAFDAPTVIVDRSKPAGYVEVA